jgi:hypothetical protein
MTGRTIKELIKRSQNGKKQKRTGKNIKKNDGRII